MAKNCALYVSKNCAVLLAEKCVLYLTIYMKSGQDKKTDEHPQISSQYGFTRGADYYKGGQD